MCSSLLQLAPGLRDLSQTERIYKITTIFTLTDNFEGVFLSCSALLSLHNML